jgi:hypothetical protein
MRSRIWAVVAASLLLCVPRQASAQERGGGDVAVGYNALHFFSEQGEPSLTLPAGFFVSGGAHVGRNVMLVGEVADSTKSVTDFGESATASILTYAVGVRIIGSGDRGGRRGPREGVRPFVEFLIGGARASASLEGETLVTGDALAILPGAGVDFPVGRRTAVRVAGKFELFQNGGTDHAFRVDIGVAFHTGRR